MFTDWGNTVGQFKAFQDAEPINGLHYVNVRAACAVVKELFYMGKLDPVEVREKDDLMELWSTPKASAGAVSIRHSKEDSIDEIFDRFLAIKSNIKNGEVKKDLDAEEKAYRKDLANARNREAEEYKYNLERTRSKENDAWADEKETREKALAAREAELKSRTDAVIEREEKMNDLESKVAEFPKRLEEATENGKAAGKAEADKSHAFEKRAMEKSAEYDKKLLESKVEAQATLIESQAAKIKELEDKLDAAYTRNQELATTVAKNSGSTTIVQSSETSGNKK
jgi:hypothetical protein